MQPVNVEIDSVHQVRATLTSGVSKQEDLCGKEQWCHTQLYLITIGLTLMVALNVVLLVWILQSVNFSTFQMELDNENRPAGEKIQLDGKLQVDGKLNVKHVSPFKSQHQLYIGSNNHMILTPFEGRDEPPWDRSWAQFHSSQIVAYAQNVVVRSSDTGQLLLLIQADPNSPKPRTTLGVDSLKIQNTNGLVLQSSIQTNTVNSSGNLYINSPNRYILVRGTRGVQLLAEGNDTSLKLTAKWMVVVKSHHGKIQFDNLIRFSDRLMTIHSTKRGRTYPSIGQVCICANSGRLFMAPNDAHQCVHLGELVCR